MRGAGKLKNDIAVRGLIPSRRIEDVLAQRMRQAVNEAIARRAVPLSDQSVLPLGGADGGRCLQIERKTMIVELGRLAEHMLGQAPEKATDPIKLDDGLIAVKSKALDHARIKGR